MTPESRLISNLDAGGNNANFFLDCVNYCFSNNRLTSSQSQGLITCLPKGGKARNLIKNWRPISLLNTTYKLLSSCLTNRLRPILCRIISKEQKGFLEYRSISDCTRLMHDLIVECQLKEISGLILLIDFEKAFDSLSWAYIKECLTLLNFGANFMKWIDIFQKNSNSRVILNGHLSEPFLLHRGCRQGDPISPYLFIICSEFLTQAIKNNDDIEGITVISREHKSSQYADDTSLFLKANEANLKNALQTLQWFYIKSGLKINETKTKVIRLGPIRETDRRFCRENNLDWVTEFTALGIHYNVLKMEDITSYNINIKKPEMTKLMHSWSCRNITPLGRITVLKSLILSKIIHILQSLPSPTQATLKELDKANFDFIWRNKRHEVNKLVLCQEWNKGGLNMLNVQEFDMSLKITWLRKLMMDAPEWEEFASLYKIERLIWTGSNYHTYMSTNIKNPFWKSVQTAFTKWYKILDQNNYVDVAYQPLWGNSNMNIPFNNTMLKKNVIFIRDLFDVNGQPLTKEILENRIGSNIMFTTFHALWRSMPGQWKIEMREERLQFNLNLPPVLMWLLKDRKGTRTIRSIWALKNNSVKPVGQEKWSLEIGIPNNLDWKMIYTLPRKCRLNARITYFQYQINHRSLVTNKKLQQFGLRDNNLCDRCDSIETISHLLFECPFAQNIWTGVERWLNQTINSDVYMDKVSVMLGNPKNEIVTNCILLIVKHELYKSKWNRTVLNVPRLKRIIKNHMDLDVYLGTIQGKKDKSLGKWSSILNELQNL